MDNINVIFTGKLSEGHDLDAVRETFSRQFNVTGAALEDIFDGDEFTLKRGLDQATADKLQRVLSHFGMEARQHHEGPEPDLVLAETTPESQDGAVDDHGETLSPDQFVDDSAELVGHVAADGDAEVPEIDGATDFADLELGSVESEAGEGVDFAPIEDFGASEFTSGEDVAVGLDDLDLGSFDGDSQDDQGLGTLDDLQAVAAVDEDVAIGLDDVQDDLSLDPLSSETAELGDSELGDDLSGLDDLGGGLGAALLDDQVVDAQPEEQTASELSISDQLGSELSLEPMENEPTERDADSPVEFFIDDPSTSADHAAGDPVVESAQAIEAEDLGNGLSLEPLTDEPEQVDADTDLEFLDDLDLDADETTDESAIADPAEDHQDLAQEPPEAVADHVSQADDPGLPEASAVATAGVALAAVGVAAAAVTDDQMDCPQCGQSQAAAQECANCGASMAQSNAGGVGWGDPLVSADGSADSKSSSGWMIALVFVLALLAALIYGALNYGPQLRDLFGGAGSAGAAGASLDDVRGALAYECEGEVDQANCDQLLQQRWDRCVASSSHRSPGPGSLSESQYKTLFDEINGCVYLEYFETGEFVPD